MNSVREIPKNKWRPISPLFELDSPTQLDDIVHAISEVCSSLESQFNPFCTLIFNDEKLVCQPQINKANWIGISKVSVSLRKEIKFELRDWSQSFMKALSEYQLSKPDSNLSSICEFLKTSIESNNISLFISSNNDHHAWCLAWGHKFEQHADHFLHDEAERPDSFQLQEEPQTINDGGESFERYSIKASNTPVTTSDFYNNEASAMKNFVISNSVLLAWFAAFLLFLGFIHWIFNH